MDKLTQLFIRACKVKNPRKRVLSVYRRFYYAGSGDPSCHIVLILAKICDTYSLFGSAALLSELHPSNAWKHSGQGEAATYEERCVGLLISKIRLTKIAVFPGLTRPAPFRNREEKAPTKTAGQLLTELEVTVIGVYVGAEYKIKEMLDEIKYDLLGCNGVWDSYLADKRGCHDWGCSHCSKNPRRQGE